jgi:molybdopterin synthase catalytic subunit
MIEVIDRAIDAEKLKATLSNPGAGGFCVFEGWVRNENDGRAVERLEYEAYEPLVISEGDRVLAEALQRFPFLEARCVHRTGLLEIGDMAVWVGVASAHRDEAFKACRYIIDELKIRLPIWKKEHYVDGDSDWVNCERCAEHGRH